MNQRIVPPRWLRARIKSVLLLSLFSSLFMAAPLLAEPPEPYLCIGYNPSRADWGVIRLRSHQEVEASCDPGYAYMSIDFIGGTPREGRKIEVLGRCCRLPDGVLTSEHLYATEDCPTGTIATGIKYERPLKGCDENWKDCARQIEEMDHFLRCTKIHEERYQLGEEKPPYVLGFNLGFNLEEGGSEPYTSRSQVPLGIRYGTSRNNLYELDGGGYIGFPWGSVLVGKHSKTRYSFRQIQYRGAAGDPPKGTPLKVIPDCESISDPLDPNAHCLKPGEKGANPLLFEIPEKPSAPPEMGRVLLRHQARILQLLWGTSVGLRLLATSKHPSIDPIIILDPNRWDVSNAEKARDSVMANIVGPMGEQEFFLKALRDKSLNRGATEFSTSKSFNAAREQIEKELEPLREKASSEQIQSVLEKISTLLRTATEALIKEGELGNFRADQILPLDLEELRELQGYGIVSRDLDGAAIDKRSERILAAVKRLPR